MELQFTSHGEFTALARGRVVVVTVRGPLNQQAIRRARPTYVRAVRPVPPGPIAELVDMRDFKGATPETYEEQVRTNIWRRRLHRQLGLLLVARARVYSSVMFEDIARLYGMVRDPERERSFTNMEEAEEWLSCMLVGASAEAEPGSIGDGAGNRSA